MGGYHIIQNKPTDSEVFAEVSESIKRATAAHKQLLYTTDTGELIPVSVTVSGSNLILTGINGGTATAATIVIITITSSAITITSKGVSYT